MRPDAVQRIGTERQPVCVFEGFSGDADALRAIAARTPFAPAGEHYPGLRAPLPPDYLDRRMPAIVAAVARTFGRCRRLRVVDASFSIVTADPARLRAAQRIPHADAHGAERIALVHYLSPTNRDGTAFYRHRATGFETVDETRRERYRAALALEPADDQGGYIDGDTDRFERTAVVDAQPDRALLYRSFVLHSGAISAGAPLPADPLAGRLTVTAFFAAE